MFWKYLGGVWEQVTDAVAGLRQIKGVPHRIWLVGRVPKNRIW
jgi:hypothetical protein